MIPCVSFAPSNQKRKTQRRELQCLSTDEAGDGDPIGESSGKQELSICARVLLDVSYEQEKSPMTFAYQSKRSSSPYVEVVWHTEDLTDGIYVASADACWDMIFIRNKEGKYKVSLCGPCFKTTLVPYSAGNRNFGIQFKPGVILTGIAATDMINVTEVLPMPSEDTFVLQGITWKLPTYERIDEFLSRMAENGLLGIDPVIMDVLENKPVNMSVRSIQRHFATTVGMSPRRVRQITSARKAVDLLLEGRQLADVSYELGYADLPHMIRMLKRFTGFTPMGNKIRGERV